VGRVYLAPISFGLGDLVVSLPVVQRLIADGARQGDETWLVARSAAQAALAERIDGLAGFVDEESVPTAGGGTRVIDLRDHPLQRDYWWGSPQFQEEVGPLDINQLLDRIAGDLGVVADFSAPVPLRFSPVAGLGNTVLLVTETDGPAKAWPPENWTALATRLRPRFEVQRVIRAAADDGGPEGAALVVPTPGAAVDTLSSCRAVIGIDTGLTHVAVQQGTPTVTICRHSSVFFRPWPHTRVLRGAPCDAACLAEEQARAYNDRVSLHGLRWRPRTCPSGQRCLAGLGPEQALQLLDELV
jgi:Glycosyltransferase family 9 (heptosyltransferase)